MSSDAPVRKRVSIGTKQRFEIFKRDKFTCQYCGAHPPEIVLHVDHIQAVANGGDNSDDNLITSCDRCNLGKGATPLSQIPKSLAERAAEVAEREEQIRGYNEVMADARDRLDDDVWDSLEPLIDHFDIDSVQRDWVVSTKRFVNELGMHEVFEAMELAVSRKPHSQYGCFKYFCGICWNKIRAQNES